jgi:Rrf2 family protein
MRLALTRRAAYAIRAVIAVARTTDDRFVPASVIGTTMSIPPNFLPQIMSDLVRQGILLAHVGRAGGYRLARPADHISMLEIVEAIEGDTRRSECVLRASACSPTRPCDVHHVFETAQESLRLQLSAASVGDIVAARPAHPPEG